LLLQALLDVRPSENRPGAAQAAYDRYFQELLRVLETKARGDLSASVSLWQLVNGQLFGITDLLRRAARDLAAVRCPVEMPTVLVVGEIYVRCVPFANDFVIEKLEQRGIRTRLAPFHEFLDYVDYINRFKAGKYGLSERLQSLVQRKVGNLTKRAMAGPMGWAEPLSIPDILDAVRPYVRDDLHGEAVLTAGTPLLEWRRGHIQAAISVGPLECMPNKIAEAQFFHMAEREGLLTLTLSLNGDTIDPEVIDNFAFEVHSRFKLRSQNEMIVPSPNAPGRESHTCAPVTQESRVSEVSGR